MQHPTDWPLWATFDEENTQNALVAYLFKKCAQHKKCLAPQKQQRFKLDASNEMLQEKHDFRNCHRIPSFSTCRTRSISNDFEQMLCAKRKHARYIQRGSGHLSVATHSLRTSCVTPKFLHPQQNKYNTQLSVSWATCTAKDKLIAVNVHDFQPHRTRIWACTTRARSIEFWLPYCSITLSHISGRQACKAHFTETVCTSCTAQDMQVELNVQCALARTQRAMCIMRYIKNSALYKYNA